MKKIISIGFMLYSLSTAAFAITCPSPQAIRDADYDRIELDADGYFVTKQGNFGTPVQWTFFITGIKARSTNEALDKMYAALDQPFTGDQEASRYQGFLRCNYYGTGYNSLAIVVEN